MNIRQAAAIAANPQARMWGSGGKHYDDVSFAISDALAHAAQRLAPAPNQRILDIATGTGWSARNVARMGAKVTAIDFAPALLEAAQQLSSHLPIEFELADAESLPFEDSAFDGVISTFGVMFAPDHAKAAGEIARVIRKGGKLALTSWMPDGAVAEFFGLIATHSNAPSPDSSPLDWGNPRIVEKLLGAEFNLQFEKGMNNAYHKDTQAIWEWYLRGFGPLCSLHDSLDDRGREVLKTDIDAYHDKYIADAGLHVRREYLVILGERR